MGVTFSNKQAANVDNSWLIAADRCWPDLGHQGLSVAGIKEYLGDPLHFRATFVGYSAQDNASLRQIVGVPVMSAPAPDSGTLNNAPNPVLTRSEAMSGSNPQGTLVSQNNGIAPNDALCAMQPGTPVGFR